MHSGSGSRFLGSSVRYLRIEQTFFKDDGLVAFRAVFVGRDNACVNFDAEVAEITDQRFNVSFAVQKEDTVDFAVFRNAGGVDDLTKVKFTFSLSFERGQRVIVIVCDEVCVVFGTFCGISVEFARCDFADARKLFKCGFKHAERNSDALDICKNYIFFACCHNLLLLFQVAKSGLVIVILY